MRGIRYISVSSYHAPTKLLVMFLEPFEQMMGRQRLKDKSKSIDRVKELNMKECCVLNKIETVAIRFHNCSPFVVTLHLHGLKLHIIANPRPANRWHNTFIRIRVAGRNMAIWVGISYSTIPFQSV